MNNATIQQAKILIIDDEPQIRRFLDISLRAQGYQTLLAETGEQGLQSLASQPADLVILDLGLPDQDGMDVLEQLRYWSQVPVIVLTVRSNENQKVTALDQGANDYVTKPFGTQELMARIRALLRHKASEHEVTPIFDDGHLKIDSVKREVWVAQQKISLSRKEFLLLSLLFKHAGRVVTQPQLMRELWGANHQEDTHYLRILTGKLRHKLGDSAVTPRYIATEAGVGLRFINESAQ